MKKSLLLFTLSLGYLATILAVGQSQPGEFDRLSDADRKAFDTRFAKEVWPLLLRNGKDGCVGCHSGKIVSALTFSGNPSKDFHFLLREGFFDATDKGSLLARVVDKDKSRRMPKHPREAWKEEDVQVLRQFTNDLDAKQKKRK